MNKLLIAALSLSALTLGTLQLPARADFNVTFGHHDHNHDGRWDYREFQDANRHYYHSHPGTVIINQRDLRHDFDRLDTDHDGYLRSDEVRTYRTWD